ncbi:peptide chain release factor N(5)-glutamine methyltransferase [Methylophaga sp.]|uniref:peptide chain release factor N(5)-glutamine methyltransferase n=1 Tax=Methylophaga sp. TaxID=2024840 RepID=UPI001400A58A|nr:peptide chain release factor N(5)-glutamine methyltransferase [Methylophaga sp.]MTI63699.1 peptide chain release factor N(5)-glutamine methyltransferase [Methylophaga sp.]
MMPTIQEARAFGLAELAVSISPDVDVQVLLCHVLACNPTQLMTAPETELTEAQWQQFAELIARRKQGEPVAHLTGSRGFWSLDLEVDNSTLIPRPDTELLVSLCLPKLKHGMTAADLGTGTGAIALSLASEKPGVHFVATDLQFAALKLAQKNADKHELDNVHFLQMSWLGGFRPRSFDLIVSNPPYIRADDPHLLQGDVRFEPRTALVSGDDGLDDIRRITEQAVDCLKPGGWLLVEHGYDQSQRVQDCLALAGFEHISAHQDFGGQDRAVMGQLAETD